MCEVSGLWFGVEGDMGARSLAESIKIVVGSVLVSGSMITILDRK